MGSEMCIRDRSFTLRCFGRLFFAVVLSCFYIPHLDWYAPVMVVDCAGVETRYIPNAVSVASFLLLLLLLTKDMHLYFLVEVLRLLINFHFGCAAAAGGACAAYNITTDAERGAGYCFFLLRFCP